MKERAGKERVPEREEERKGWSNGDDGNISKER